MFIKNPSPQQEDGFNWIQLGRGSAVVRAVAGAGKTSFLVHGVQLMSGSVFFGAYNKDIAAEIKSRIPERPGLFISTMHAAGLRVWRRAAPGIKPVEANKCRNIFRDAVSRNPDYKPFEGCVLALVSYAKQSGLGIFRPVTDDDAWKSLIDHYNVDCLDFDELVIKLARATLKRSFEMDREVIDFDDMIYAPLVHNAKFYTHDWVLIDEAQDTNAVRRELAMRMLAPGGRLVAVGDEFQAIYGFTGADSDALDLIQAETGARDLPLTVTYRCPKSVVQVARQYVDHIEAHETAPEGKVERLSYENTIKTLMPGDMVLCRFTAPLITMAYSLISSGVPARVLGRDIGAGLKKLAARWKVDSFDQLLEKVAEYEERETKKFREKEQESRAQAVEDTVSCLHVVINRVMLSGKTGSPAELVAGEIDSIFGEEDSGKPVVGLSSIHRSKGQEWERVFWMQSGPSQHARKPWEIRQELNLNYVAATRAKSELFLCEMPPKKKK